MTLVTRELSKQNIWRENLESSCATAHMSNVGSTSETKTNRGNINWALRVYYCKLEVEDTKWTAMMALQRLIYAMRELLPIISCVVGVARFLGSLLYAPTWLYTY